MGKVLPGSARVGITMTSLTCAPIMFRAKSHLPCYGRSQRREAVDTGVEGVAYLGDGLEDLKPGEGANLKSADGSAKKATQPIRFG